MWLQTGAYELTSLYWLIAMIVIAIIAIIALIVAARALAQSRVHPREAMGARGASMGAQGASGMGSDDRQVPESQRMLDERYAKGEISREEYVQRQTDLQSKV